MTTSAMENHCFISMDGGDRLYHVGVNPTDPVTKEFTGKSLIWATWQSVPTGEEVVKAFEEVHTSATIPTCIRKPIKIIRSDSRRRRRLISMYCYMLVSRNGVDNAKELPVKPEGRALPDL